MKKLFLLATILAVLAIPVSAMAKAPPYQMQFWSFATDPAASGATSVAIASGASQLVVSHANQKRSSGTKTVDMANPAYFTNMGSAWMVWARDVDFSPAQVTAGGTVSDDFDLYLEFYPRSSVESSVTRYVFKDEPITSLSNNVAGPVFIDAPSNCTVKAWIVSGTTPLGNIEIEALVGLPESFSRTSDRTTNAAVILNHITHEIHEGDHYFISGNTTMVSGATKAFTVYTPPDAGINAYMTFSVSSSTTLTAEVYEETSGIATAGTGTPATPINNNRTSSNTSKIHVTEDPDFVKSGTSTMLDSMKFGTSGTKFVPAIGAETGREDEMVLNSGVTYLYLFTSGAADNIVSYRGSWYEK